MTRRRRYSLQPWIGRVPQRGGSRRTSNPEGPPPNSVNSDAMVHTNSTLNNFTKPDPPHLGIRRGESTRSRSVDLRAWTSRPPRSRAPSELQHRRGRPPTQTTTPTAPPAPQRRRLVPTRHYAMYTRRSGAPSPSRRRSGRRRARDPPNHRR